VDPGSRAYRDDEEKIMPKRREGAGSQALTIV